MSELRPLTRDEFDPESKNYILEHPKLVAIYRNLTQLQSSAPKTSGVIRRSGDRNDILVNPAP